MIRRQPSSTRTDTLYPNTSLYRYSRAVFGAGVLWKREAARLAPLLLPYLLVLGALATGFGPLVGSEPLAASADAWLVAHIVTAVATYGLCTVAAVAGAAVFLQERALKRRRPNTFTRLLPSAADAERDRKSTRL